MNPDLRLVQPFQDVLNAQVDHEEAWRAQYLLEVCTNRAQSRHRGEESWPPRPHPPPPHCFHLMYHRYETVQGRPRLLRSLGKHYRCQSRSCLRANNHALASQFFYPFSSTDGQNETAPGAFDVKFYGAYFELVCLRAFLPKFTAKSIMPCLGQKDDKRVNVPCLFPQAIVKTPVSLVLEGIFSLTLIL